MNWNRAKIILIFLFLLINFFLFNMLSGIDEKYETINDSVIENAVIAAQSKGINISKDIIPTRRYKDGEMELFGIASDHESAAKRFLGKKAELVAFDEEEHFYRYEDDRGKVLEINKSELHFLANDEIKEIKNEKDAAEKAIYALEKFDIKRKDITIVKDGKENEKSFLLIKPRYKGINIDGAELRVYYDAEKVTELAGSWFDFSTFTQKGDFLDDVTAVIATLKPEPDEEIEIIKVDFSYYVSRELIYGKYVSAIPVYSLKKADGGQIIIDARTGENVE